MISSLAALVLANTDWGVARYFPAIWESHLRVAINGFVLDKSLLHWINDGLMAVFFLIVGLEIKREVLEGELSSWQKAAMPLAGALGGMLVPALLFWLLNRGTPTAGAWGIPMATDIAFALAVLQLLGPRVPLSLKVFLTALAIVDDLGAVLVIAGFYTTELSLAYLWWALGVWGALLLLNRAEVRSLWAYLPLGVVLWYCMLKSGVHATLAGVLVAVAIPFRIQYSRSQLLQLLDERLALLKNELTGPDADPRTISEELEAVHLGISSPAQRLEQQLHGVVAFGIIPLFAFANTSLVINPGVLRELASPLALGVLAGLVVGKPVGILLLARVAARLGLATLPADITWRHLLGTGMLAGIGFTMSIFITLLALEGQLEAQDVAKTAVLLASLVSGGAGYLLLRNTSQVAPAQ